MQNIQNDPNIKFKVLFTHRAIVCSLSKSKDCAYLSYFFKPIEDLLHKYGVRLAFNGHIHTYQRTNPVYNYQVFEPNDEMLYVDLEEDELKNDQKGTIYITAGHSGTTHHLETKPQEGNSSIIDKVYVTGRDENFFILEHKPDRLKGMLVQSEDRELLDRFEFYPDKNVVKNTLDITDWVSVVLWILFIMILLAGIGG